MDIGDIWLIYSRDFSPHSRRSLPNYVTCLFSSLYGSPNVGDKLSYFLEDRLRHIHMLLVCREMSHKDFCRRLA